MENLISSLDKSAEDYLAQDIKKCKQLSGEEQLALVKSSKLYLLAQKGKDLASIIQPLNIEERDKAIKAATNPSTLRMAQEMLSNAVFSESSNVSSLKRIYKAAIAIADADKNVLHNAILRLSSDIKMAEFDKHIRTGRKDFNALVESNVRFILKKALKNANNTNASTDLYNEGIFGIIRAIELFDPTVDVGFLSYAGFWVSRYINLANLVMAKDVKIPPHYFSDYHIIQNATADLEAKQIFASLEEISKITGFDVEYIKRVTGYMRFYNADSLDRMVCTENSAEPISMANFVPDENSDVNMITENTFLQESIEKALAKLWGRDSKEYKVITLRYGLGGYPEMTLEEIGISIGFTKERIRQIEERALSILAQDEGLRDIGSLYLGRNIKAEQEELEKKKGLIENE